MIDLGQEDTTELRQVAVSPEDIMAQAEECFVMRETAADSSDRAYFTGWILPERNAERLNAGVELMRLAVELRCTEMAHDFNREVRDAHTVGRATPSTDPSMH